MKVIVLDGGKIAGIEDVYKAFGKAVTLPEHFGNNLDALHDVLTESRARICVIVDSPGALKKALGRRAAGFGRLMTDLRNEREGFYYIDDLERFGKPTID